ncbi:ABC Superfamily [Phytophthora palmivora]|uniref:ABC Superfamily n=1 Tax=Phytophthora palmivora TaxID=4796 RepID=A0A2P4YQA3_9STRA|nr:ABC Superfamily [Phytophthora palmivora]
MPKKASTHDASAPSKSKTARSKTTKANSKDKATPRKEDRKTASRQPASLPLLLPPKEGARNASPVFDIPMITGSASDEDTTRSTKDPTPSQDTPSQGIPVEDPESSEAKAASTSSPTKNRTLEEGKARAQAAKAASQNRADEGAGAAKKRAVPGSPLRESGLPKEISNDFDEQQERYQTVQLQDAPALPTPVYPRGYYPPDAGSGSPLFLEHLKAPRGLNHGCTSRGAYERALVQVEPLFVNDIEAARYVLLAPHRIPLKELTSLRKKPEDRGGLFPVWSYLWVQPENIPTQSQAEDLFWRWVSLKNFTVQELKELR